MGIYEDIEKIIHSIDIERKSKEKNEETVKICIRLPKSIVLKLKMNKLLAEQKNTTISLQDQVICALKHYLNEDK